MAPGAEGPLAERGWRGTSLSSRAGEPLGGAWAETLPRSRRPLRSEELPGPSPSLRPRSGCEQLLYGRLWVPAPHLYGSYFGKKTKANKKQSGFGTFFVRL